MLNSMMVDVEGLNILDDKACFPRSRTSNDHRVCTATAQPNHLPPEAYDRLFFW